MTTRRQVRFLSIDTKIFFKKLENFEYWSENFFSGDSAPEIEEILPLTSVANQQQKKDAEKFNNADMGLANTVHKIVKGDIQRVEGNRVYLRVNQDKIRENELYKLIAYLDKKIAEPNNLYFDEFQYNDGQLSFRVSRFDGPRHKNEKEKRLDSASGVAQAVCKCLAKKQLNAKKFRSFFWIPNFLNY